MLNRAREVVAEVWVVVPVEAEDGLRVEAKEEAEPQFPLLSQKKIIK